MDASSDSFTAFLREQFSALTSPAVGLQMGIVIIAAAVAWLVRQQLRGEMTESATEFASSSRQIRAHTSRILLFPVVMLIGVLMGCSIGHRRAARDWQTRLGDRRGISAAAKNYRGEPA